MVLAPHKGLGAADATFLWFQAPEKADNLGERGPEPKKPAYHKKGAPTAGVPDAIRVRAMPNCDWGRPCECSECSAGPCQVCGKRALIIRGTNMVDRKGCTWTGFERHCSECWALRNAGPEDRRAPNAPLAPDTVPSDPRVPGPQKRSTISGSADPNQKSRPGGPSSSEAPLVPEGRVPSDPMVPNPRKRPMVSVSADQNP